MKNRRHPGSIVRSYLKMWPREIFDLRTGSKLVPEIRSLLNAPGVYVLYRDDQPYYVGRATRALRHRLHAHANQPKDRYYNFWNFFSAFVVSDPRHIPEVEGILIAAFPTESVRFIREGSSRCRSWRRRRRGSVAAQQRVEADERPRVARQALSDRVPTSATGIVGGRENGVAIAFFAPIVIRITVALVIGVSTKIQAEGSMKNPLLRKLLLVNTVGPQCRCYDRRRLVYETDGDGNGDHRTDASTGHQRATRGPR